MAEGPSLTGYVSLGWKVFPCHGVVDGTCTCGNRDCESPGKHPRTHNGVKAATDNIEQLRSWYKQFAHCNWGIACGQASGIIVIDLDPRKDGYDSFDEYEQNRHGKKNFSATLIANTGGGGRHIFLKAPDQPVKNRVNWMPGVDIRGDGGYVILPPGTHISGATYEWENWGHPIMDAPKDFLADIGGSTAGSQEQYLKDLSIDDFISGIEEGARDDTLFRMACKLRRQLNDNRAAITMLVLTAAANSSPPFSEKEALKKIDQAFKQDHSDLDMMVFQDGDGNDRPLANLTDMGNRDRFIEMFGDDYRYVVGAGWHKWADDGWHKVDELVPHRDAQQVPEVIRTEAEAIGDMTTRNRFLKWAKDSESSGKIGAILTMAKGHETIKRTMDDFDNNPYALACSNGMVDLRDGSIRPFTRDDLFTRNTKVVYDDSYTLKKWDEFIKVVTDGDNELAEYLQMSAGYSLTGLISEESFFIISGMRQTGKSTFVTAFEGCMGTYADVASADVFMKRYGKDAPREELVKFAGSRLITVEEIPEGERFDDALLKRITGGSRLSARYLYQEMFTYVPQFKIWMATNYDPITSDPGMYRRIKRISFDTPVPEEKKDPTLKTVLRDRSTGARAVLKWAVEGAMKYIDAGKLVTPHKVIRSTHDYESEQDSFSHFVNETFYLEPGEKIPESLIYSLYSDWAKRNNERYLKRPQFAQKMRERGFPLIIDDATHTRYVENLKIRVTNIFAK